MLSLKTADHAATSKVFVVVDGIALKEYDKDGLPSPMD